MIVRHFIQWVRNAPAGARADATGALARAYLYAPLSDDDRAAAEGAMLMLLDDPSPLVRQALAEALAGSPDAPAAVVFALSEDRPEIAAAVLERSPLLLDADLVEAVGSGCPLRQAAVARRSLLPCPVAAALAEVGSAEACLILIENPEAVIPAFSLSRIVERFGHLAAIREALLGHADLPSTMRQLLLVKLSETLAEFVTAQRWLKQDRARRVAREACEQATVALAAEVPQPQVRPLISHLRQSGQLTAGLLLRALLSGNGVLFEEALAELSGLSPARVAGLVHDNRGGGVRALLQQAGVPAAVIPAIRAAVEALHEIGYAGELGGTARLKRRVIERVLTSCGDGERTAETDALLVLLRRFAVEAAREEARLFCDELQAA